MEGVHLGTITFLFIEWMHINWPPKVKSTIVLILICGSLPKFDWCLRLTLSAYQCLGCNDSHSLLIIDWLIKRCWCQWQHVAWCNWKRWNVYQWWRILDIIMSLKMTRLLIQLDLKGITSGLSDKSLMRGSIHFNEAEVRTSFDAPTPNKLLVGTAKLSLKIITSKVYAYLGKHATLKILFQCPNIQILMEDSYQDLWWQVSTD